MEKVRCVSQTIRAMAVLAAAGKGSSLEDPDPWQRK